MQNNPLTEIIMGVLSALLIVAGALLFYFGKVDFAGAGLLFTLAAGMWGVNSALKVPSAGQQTQINTLQQGLQDLINLFASHTHPVPPTPPSTPTQPVQPAPAGQVPLSELKLQPGQTVQAPQFVPDPGVSMAAYQTSQMPAVTPQVQP